MSKASIPNFSFLGSLEVAQIYLPGWGVGLTVIIMQISVQIVLNWNWQTGTELGKKSSNGPPFGSFLREKQAGAELG